MEHECIRISIHPQHTSPNTPAKSLILLDTLGVLCIAFLPTVYRPYILMSIVYKNVLCIECIGFHPRSISTIHIFIKNTYFTRFTIYTTYCKALSYSFYKKKYGCPSEVRELNTFNTLSSFFLIISLKNRWIGAVYCFYTQYTRNTPLYTQYTPLDTTRESF